jgi:hypothetical protein
MLLVPPPTTLRHTRYPLQVSNNMMTYLLINDINSATAIANPMMPLDNPSDLFAENACHNGFWRSAFVLRSIVEVVRCSFSAPCILLSGLANPLRMWYSPPPSFIYYFEQKFGV